MKIRIAANYPNAPYFYTNVKNNISVITNGLDFRLINLMTEYLNLSYEVIHSDWDWGRIIEGKWTGMIGKITESSADMALGGLTANPEREKVVDFTIPYAYSDITFFSRKTKLNSLNTRPIFLQPFATEVWICLWLSIPFSLLMMKICRQQSLEILKIITRALLHQNIPSIPRHLRLFAISWIIYGLILCEIHSSLLMLYTSELIPRPGISNIEELAIAVENGQYLAATSAEGSLYSFIKGIKSSLLNSIANSLIGINQINKAIQLMLTSMPQLVYICPRIQFKARISKSIARLFHIPPKNDETTFITEQLAIAMTKNSEFIPKINKLIRRIESRGLTKHWISKVSINYKFKNQYNYVNSNDCKDRVGLFKINFIFYLWSFGLFLALIIYFCESLINHFYKLSIRIICR